MNTNLAAGILISLAALGLLVFAVLYTWRANWRETPLGRHMFYFAWAFLAAYIVGVARQWYPDQEWLNYARLVSLSLVVAVLWQRVYLLVKSLHLTEPNDASMTTSDQSTDPKEETDGRP